MSVGGRLRVAAVGASVIVHLFVSTAVAADTTRTPTARGLRPIAPFMGQHWAVPNLTLPTDRNGVVLVEYGGTLGKQYNPVAISQQAIAAYTARFHGDLSLAEKAEVEDFFFRQVDWLLANQEPDGRWLYRFTFAGIKPPWQSAMAQGLGMSALLRAHSLRPDSRYLDAIARARSRFERVWSRGGVGTFQAVGTKSFLVYEEYMPPYSLHTLNGWIFAIAGLREIALYLGDPMAHFDLHDSRRGYAALKALLPYYDTGRWSTYNLLRLSPPPRGTNAKMYYHGLHIRQLRWLADVTGEAIFRVYADRFQGYLDTCLALDNCPGT